MGISLTPKPRLHFPTQEFPTHHAKEERKKENLNRNIPKGKPTQKHVRVQNQDLRENFHKPSSRKIKMARRTNLSWPAVSQIWALMILSSTRILLVANSTPIVDLASRLNSLRVNLERRLDFPTPESPIKTTLKR